MQLSQMFNVPKNAFWLWFHHQLMKTALQTQIMVYAAFANAQHAENRVFALFSSWSFEICSRKANTGICSIRKCSTCRENVFLNCFYNHPLKSALETQVKAYAAVANVQHAEKRYLTVISTSTFENYFTNANNGICSIRKCSTCRKTLFASVFIINFWKLLKKRKYRYMQ